MRAFTLARYVKYLTRIPCYSYDEKVWPDGKLCRDCDAKVLVLLGELIEHIHEETVEPKATAASTADPWDSLNELESVE